MERGRAHMQLEGMNTTSEIAVRVEAIPNSPDSSAAAGYYAVHETLITRDGIISSSWVLHYYHYCSSSIACILHTCSLTHNIIIIVIRDNVFIVKAYLTVSTSPFTNTSHNVYASSHRCRRLNTRSRSCLRFINPPALLHFSLNKSWEQWGYLVFLLYGVFWEQTQ